MSKFNQHTHDYVLDGITKKVSNDIADNAYLRLVTPLGSYFDDVDFGSELYLLKRNKDLPRIRKQALSWAKKALEPMRELFYLIDIQLWTIDSDKNSAFVITGILKTADGATHQTYINVQVAG